MPKFRIVSKKHYLCVIYNLNANYSHKLSLIKNYKKSLTQ